MTQPPFGTYSLTAREKFSRKWGVKLQNDPFSKVARTALKHIAGTDQKRPRDLVVFETQKARLHPYDNICEKRVFLTPHLWETQEREGLRNHILNHQSTEFYFVDAGSNVGLYTLFARHCAAQSGLSFRGICIEPGPVTFARLQQNIAMSNFSQAEALMYQAALSDKTQTVTLLVDENNLGESRIGLSDIQKKPQNIEIETVPLLDLIERSTFPRIDALKIDIEGQEWPVLKHFFKKADQKLFPALIIMEMAHTSEAQKLLSLCHEENYQSINQNRGNIILSRVRKNK